MRRKNTIIALALVLLLGNAVGLGFAQASRAPAEAFQDARLLAPRVERLAKVLGTPLPGQAAIDPMTGLHFLLRPLHEAVGRMEFTPDDLTMELTLRSFVEQIHAFVNGRPWGAEHGGGAQRLAGALEGLVRILAERPPRGRIQARSAGSGFAKATGTGSISGTVTQEGTATLLEGIDVRVFDASNDWVGFASTDASGNYSVSGLGTGTYFATTYKAGDYYIDELYMDAVCFNPWSCLVTSGTPISVTDGIETAGIDFGLAVGASIKVYVGEDGTLNPLTGAYVTAVDQFGVTASAAATASDGRGRIWGLPTGDYYLVASSSGHVIEVYENIPTVGWVADALQGTPVHVTTDGGIPPGVMFYLALEGTIGGTVTEQGTGTAIPNASIQVFDAEGAQLPRFGLMSDGTGAFTVGQLLSGSYYVTCTAGTYIPELWENEVCVGCDVTTGTAIGVTQPSATTGVDFELDKGGRILGTVTLEGSPSTKIENAFINVFDGSGTPVDGGLSVADGSYGSFGGLPTGSYVVTASDLNGDYVAEVYNNMQCFPCWTPTGTAVSVTAPDDTTGIDFSLSPGGAIEGTVTVEGSGLPLGLAGVYLYNSGGTAIVASAGSGSSGGDYKAAGLPTGTYYATAHGAEGGVGIQSELFDDILCPLGICDPTTGSSISVTSPSTTSNVDFDLPLGGRIAGRVTDASTGIPLVRMSVDVYDAGGAFVGTATSSSYGLYATKGLADGTYYALAEDNSGAGYASELFDGTPCDGCDVTTGTAIVISSTDTYLGVDFSLSPPGSVVHLDLTSTSPVSGTETYEASGTITAGGTFGVEAPGDVTLRAGGQVILTNGFFVATGATLTIEIDPGL